ncbi:hypothetical protein LINGRAHAP2_LOCUS16221 [Linum grandiflorum]
MMAVEDWSGTILDFRTILVMLLSIMLLESKMVRGAKSFENQIRCGWCPKSRWSGVSLQGSAGSISATVAT